MDKKWANPNFKKELILDNEMSTRREKENPAIMHTIKFKKLVRILQYMI